MINTSLSTFGAFVPCAPFGLSHWRSFVCLVRLSLSLSLIPYQILTVAPLL
jgi:hypothetical protein